MGKWESLSWAVPFWLHQGRCCPDLTPSALSQSRAIPHVERIVARAHMALSPYCVDRTEKNSWRDTLLFFHFLLPTGGEMSYLVREDGRERCLSSPSSFSYNPMFLYLDVNTFTCLITQESKIQLRSKATWVEVRDSNLTWVWFTSNGYEPHEVFFFHSGSPYYKFL